MYFQKKIKILFRHRSMEMGGAEKVLLSMLENLDKEKFQMTLLLSLNQGEFRDAVPPHVKKRWLAEGKEDFSKNLLLQKIQLLKRRTKLASFTKNPQRIEDRVLKEKFDIEIASGYVDFDLVLNSSNPDSKKIGWLHSDLTLKGFDGLRPKIFRQLQKFDYLIFGSQQSYDVLLEKYPGLQLPPSEVILNAIPIEEIKRKAEEFKPYFGNVPTFISVARLHYRKGFLTLLEAHKMLIDSGFQHQIIIIGDGEERPKLEAKIKEYGAEDSFKLLGTLMNPYPYVKNADFYIMPSLSEGWPLIIAETLILQKPIIATNVGGIPEMITHQKNGYLIEYDAGKMAEAMKLFLTDKQRVTTIKENLKHSEEQFDNRKIFGRVEEILLNLTK